MIYTSDQLLKLIHDTGALSIWDRKKGPVFWYIAGVPGPFYINTELLIGEILAKTLLTKIDAILATIPGDNPAGRAAQIEPLILEAYEKEPVYKNIIATMIKHAEQKFPLSAMHFVSGGERRDWIFSLPFAKECGIKHAYLFKNKTHYCKEPLAPHKAGLHVSDLINNAASYVDTWLPMLEPLMINISHTICIISRGANGIKVLAENGVQAFALQQIDYGFFSNSMSDDLITQDTLNEIELHFKSPKEWAMKYLMGKVDLFDVEHAHKKSFERMRSFFTSDPWSLRASNEAFFATMQEKIAARLKNQAA